MINNRLAQLLLTERQYDAELNEATKSASRLWDEWLALASTNWRRKQYRDFCKAERHTIILRNRHEYFLAQIGRLMVESFADASNELLQRGGIAVTTAITDSPAEVDHGDA